MTRNVIGRCNELADEEHALFQKESRGEASDQDRERLKVHSASASTSAGTCSTNAGRGSAAGMDPTTRTFVTSAPSKATSTSVPTVVCGG